MLTIQSKKITQVFQDYLTKLRSSMIYSDRPTVSPVANIVFA